MRLCVTSIWMNIEYSAPPTCTAYLNFSIADGQVDDAVYERFCIGIVHRPFVVFVKFFQVINYWLENLCQLIQSSAF